MSRLPALVRTVASLAPLGAATTVLGCVAFVRWHAAGHLHADGAAGREKLDDRLALRVGR